MTDPAVSHSDVTPDAAGAEQTSTSATAAVLQGGDPGRMNGTTNDQDDERRAHLDRERQLRETLSVRTDATRLTRAERNGVSLALFLCCWTVLHYSCVLNAYNFGLQLAPDGTASFTDSAAIRRKTEAELATDNSLGRPLLSQFKYIAKWILDSDARVYDLAWQTYPEVKAALIAAVFVLAANAMFVTIRLQHYYHHRAMRMLGFYRYTMPAAVFFLVGFTLSVCQFDRYHDTCDNLIDLFQCWFNRQFHTESPAQLLLLTVACLISGQAAYYVLFAERRPWKSLAYQASEAVLRLGSKTVYSFLRPFTLVLNSGPLSSWWLSKTKGQTTKSATSSGVEADDALAVNPDWKQQLTDMLEPRVFPSKWEAGLSSALGDVFDIMSSYDRDSPHAQAVLRQMQAEVVDMCIKLFHGEKDYVGSCVSSSVEAIFMVVKAYKGLMRSERAIVSPNMVVPSTAHPAFEQAGEIFGVQVRRVAIDHTQYNFTQQPDRQEFKRQAKKQLDQNTILIVASCPDFVSGSIEPLKELGKLAARRKIPFHVDSTMFGMTIPFKENQVASMSDEPLTLKFGFASPFIHSISLSPSVDTAFQGCSVVLYGKRNVREFQYYIDHTDNGSAYSTATLSNMECRTLVALTWFELNMRGEEGYRSRAHRLWTAATRVQQELKSELDTSRRFQPIEQWKFVPVVLWKVPALATSESYCIAYEKTVEAMKENPQTFSTQDFECFRLLPNEAKLFQLVVSPALSAVDPETLEPRAVAFVRYIKQSMVPFL
eukprot:m.24856 g.24856  ORF g.24856 m.24856 type:complete len:769 (-) comp8648_c0_seq1:42-2348(-)